MLDPAATDRIRAIFLHPERYVTKREAAALLGCSVGDVTVAISAGVIETDDTCRGQRVPLHELATLARARWQLPVIEEALGADAPSILPPALWSRPVSFRVASYHLQTLDYLASKANLPVDAILARVLDDVIGANSDELEEVITDYRAAIHWPEAEDAAPRALAAPAIEA